jgi:hypothetical protein
VPVAERLDALGVSWVGEVPDGRYAALAVWMDARLQEK